MSRYKKSRSQTGRNRNSRRGGVTAAPRGKPINRQTLLDRSGIKEEIFTHAEKEHLIPGALQPEGCGIGSVGASYEYREGHIDYARIVQKARSAGYSYAEATLLLLVEGLSMPLDGMERVRKAFIKYGMALCGEHVNRGDLRRLAANKRRTPAVITKRVYKYPVGLSKKLRMSESWRDDDVKQHEALRFNDEARAYSPNPRAPALGMDQAKTVRAAGLRSFYGRQDPTRYPEDKVYPGVGPVRLLEVIQKADHNTFYNAMLIAQKFRVQDKHVLAWFLRQLPISQGRSDTEIIERILPFPGLFQGVPLDNAVIPLTMLAVLLNPSVTADDLPAMLNLLLGPRLAGPVADELERIVDSLPPEALAMEVTV